MQTVLRTGWGISKKRATNRVSWWHVVDNTIHIIGELERNDIHYQIDNNIYYSFSQIFFQNKLILHFLLN